MSARNVETKVLRVGIVRDDKLAEERVVNPGDSVVFGGKDFPYAVPGVAGEHVLFQARDGKYTLRALDGFKGKVTSEGQPWVLERARKDGSLQVVDGVASLALAYGDKGKITVGDVTVLFQFVSQAVVAPPPAPATPQSFRAPLISSEDRTFFGFMLLFYALGAIVGVSAAYTQVIEQSAADYKDVYEALLENRTPPPPQQAPEVVEDEGTTEPEPEPEAEPEPEVAQTERTPQERSQQVAAAREAVGQSAIFQSMRNAIIGTTGVGGGLVTQMDGGASAGLSDSLDAVAGMDGAATGGIRGVEGAPGGPGARGIGGVGTGSDANVGSTMGSAPVVNVKKKAQVAADDITGDSTITAGVASVVRRNRGTVTYCYENQLKINPKLEGRVVISVTVSGFAASDAFVEENTTGDAELAECIKRKVKRWAFEGVDDGEARIPFLLSAVDE